MRVFVIQIKQQTSISELVAYGVHLPGRKQAFVRVLNVKLGARKSARSGEPRL